MLLNIKKDVSPLKIEPKITLPFLFSYFPALFVYSDIFDI